MATFQNAFISYGRGDSKAFAAQLNDRLMAAGLTIWFDFEDIPLGVDYQKQIDDGIEKADNFLFLISPHSVNSPYCGLEVELALKRGKRIIPLLHVEQISRDTWQERNPGGTDEQWAEYQAAGKHSSFANMHPAISKINWVYFREGIDDFEAGLQGLLDIFARQQGYVRQHTELLAAALTWEHNQKRTQYLLTGQARQQAEDWLQVRFPEEQPPCVPTDLHCEYITESIKNAHNLMTQVFLAHAETDAPVMQQIRRCLQREGLTVWTSATDIRSGEDFQQAINRGIEQADNLVYLLSPAAIASEFCQQELDYALSLNKRVIPVLVSETDTAIIPAALQGLQYIEWLSSEEDGAQANRDRPLLKALKDDAAYFNEHKVLLTQALKWERQQRNPSILLRGYNLRHAEAWLKVAQTRARHEPIARQTEFLQESLRQPPAPSLDVFISYSRVDSDFARQLNDRLQLQGKLTWFDQESIASGADFQQEIYRGIETSDHFLFILSPEAVNSPYCADEVEYAHKLNKRVVTVRHRPVDTADLHPVLAAVQWIDFRQGEGDFNANFKELLRTLETDRAHLEAHTRLLVKALEWENKQRSDDVLLRGRELLWAERWSQETVAYDKQPSMTAPQKEFIAASATFHDKNLQREARRRRLKGWMQIGTAIAVLMGMGISGTLSLRNGQKAVNDVAAQLHQELSGRIEDNIAQQIKLPNLINQINANAARRGELTTQSLASETYLWQQMQYLDAVSWMYYAAASNGSFVGIRRSLEDNLQAVINDPTSDFLGHYYDLDAQGQRTTLASVNQATYDARERPWFLTAVAANEPIWSNVYVNTGLGELIFSAVAPVYDAGGDLLGVAGVDYSFNDLSTFLEALEIGKTGEAFIMESSGLLVASSTGEALYQLTDDNNVERIEAINSENNLTQSTAQVIDQRLELPALSERAQLSAVIDGEEHFIQVSKFADQQGIDWVIVVMIPQSDFLGEINKNSRTTLLLMLLATGLTVVTIVTAHQLSEISERSVK